MGEEIELQPEENGYTRKFRIIGQLINQVGVPTIIVLTILGLFGLTWAGKIPSPFVNSKDFENLSAELTAHKVYTQISNDALLKEAKENIEVLKEIKISLRAMNCNLSKHDKEKVDCLNKLNGTE